MIFSVLVVLGCVSTSFRKETHDLKIILQKTWRKQNYEDICLSIKAEITNFESGNNYVTDCGYEYIGNIFIFVLLCASGGVGTSISCPFIRNLDNFILHLAGGSNYVHLPVKIFLLNRSQLSPDFSLAIKVFLCFCCKIGNKNGCNIFNQLTCCMKLRYCP